MEHSSQTVSQVDRALDRTFNRFPPSSEPSLFTDIHLRVSGESGELLSFNDDGEELNRAVISDWIENRDEDFFPSVAALLRQRLSTVSDKIDRLGIAKPFSFTLEDNDSEQQTELFVADDDTIIIGDDLMSGLSADLDAFLEQLMSD